MKKNFYIFLILFVSLVHVSLLEATTLLDRIHVAIEDYIYSGLEADSISITFDALNQELPTIQDISNVTIDVLWNRPIPSFVGKASVPVQIIEGGQVVGLVHNIVRTRVFDRVWVSQTVLSRHQMIRNHHVAIEMRETTQLIKTPLPVNESAQGKRTKRVVGKGRILTLDVLETPPSIRRGDRVSVQLHHNNLEITLDATAREDGWIGDQIKVRDNRSKSELMGEVIGPASVQVQF